SESPDGGRSSEPDSARFPGEDAPAQRAYSPTASSSQRAMSRDSAPAGRSARARRPALTSAVHHHPRRSPRPPPPATSRPRSPASAAVESVRQPVASGPPLLQTPRPAYRSPRDGEGARGSVIQRHALKCISGSTRTILANRAAVQILWSFFGNYSSMLRRGQPGGEGRALAGCAGDR